ETYSPDDFILGPDLVVTTVGHFQGGINVPRLTPIMLDATVGTFKVWDGSVGKAIGLTATAVNTGSSSADCSYYKSGSFRYTAINWGT
ncbi:head decoration protein, partial [Escherichia coli]